MALYNTSNTIDNSIYLKANLAKNMVGENYYIENLQHKRNQDWYCRYNVVDIKEELNKQVTYTNEEPLYTDIEAAIRNVKSITGQDLGTDWVNIAFKDLQHYSRIGSRYKFPVEKGNPDSIWICINRFPVKAGNQSVLRRCNTVLGIAGYNGSTLTERHYEPCILENDLKYIQTYTNLAMPVAQSEWYATVQLNYFTNHIKINDRFIFGTVDLNDKDNNTVFKVKAVVKAETQSTFPTDDMATTPLVILGLDKDLIQPDDDFENRIASNAPKYSIPSSASKLDFTLIPEQEMDCIPLGETKTFRFHVEPTTETIYTYALSLPNIIQSNWNNYFSYIVEDDDIKITNIKACTKGKLQLNVIADTGDMVLTETYEIVLGRR